MVHIQIASDLHLEFYKTLQEVPYIQPTAPILVLGGDVGYPTKPLFWDFLERCSRDFKHVLFVFGNHEYYFSTQQFLQGKILAMSDVEALVRDTLAHKGLTNVHLLQKASVVLEGIRFVGATLWTAIAEGSAGSRINDFRKILGDEGRVFTVSDMSALHDDHAAFLQSELQTSSPHPTVVITHHLPTWSMIADKYVGDPMNNAFASSVLDTLLVVPRAWICGHSHSPVRKTVRGCECILHPWGYPGEDGVRGTTAVLTVDV